MKRKMKKIAAFLLAVIVAISATGMVTIAADYKGEVKVIDMPRSKDPNKSGWGHPALNFLGGSLYLGEKIQSAEREMVGNGTVKNIKSSGESAPLLFHGIVI